MATSRPTRLLRTLVEWCALLAIAVLLGLLAARIRLFDSGWAVAVLGVVIAVLIGIGVHGYRHLWDEDEDDDGDEDSDRTDSGSPP